MSSPPNLFFVWLWQFGWHFYSDRYPKPPFCCSPRWQFFSAVQKLWFAARILWKTRENPQKGFVDKCSVPFVPGNWHSGACPKPCEKHFITFFYINLRNCYTRHRWESPFFACTYIWTRKFGSKEKGGSDPLLQAKVKRGGRLLASTSLGPYFFLAWVHGIGCSMGPFILWTQVLEVFFFSHYFAH